MAIKKSRLQQRIDKYFREHPDPEPEHIACDVLMERDRHARTKNKLRKLQDEIRKMSPAAGGILTESCYWCGTEEDMPHEKNCTWWKLQKDKKATRVFMEKRY